MKTQYVDSNGTALFETELQGIPHIGDFVVVLKDEVEVPLAVIRVDWFPNKSVVQVMLA